jgi:protein-S-isoprenylcysteine O-methyltransferase Ste14
MPLIKLPPKTNKHDEEVLKLLASGSQLLALALTSSAVIAPFFTTTVSAPPWERWTAVMFALVAETLALTFLRLIPTIEPIKGPTS